MSRLSLLSGTAVFACVSFVSAAACAQQARTFDIPPGALGDALTTFATQSDQQILFSGDLVAGRRSDGLRGVYPSSEALNRLLTGTGLMWAQTRPGVIYLRRPAADGAQAEGPTAVEDVVVTGTLLSRPNDLASPVTVLDRNDLDRRGFGTVADTLVALPQNYAGTSTPLTQAAMSDPSTSNNVFATGVNLRGLGPASTLVLVNGRRLSGTGARAEFADVSAIPSAAVERVDVLLDGASALYGADAVAGVVNVIMRRSFDGQESRLRVAAARGGAEDFQVSHLAGRSWSSGAAYLSYEYQTANGLSSADRAYTRDGDLRPFGGTDHRGLYSAPGNIVAFDPVRSAYVAQFGVRPNIGGTAQSPADFTVGQPNLQSAMLGADLLPNLERHGVYGRVRQAFGDKFELNADVRYSHRTNTIASAASTAVFAVTRNNPWFVSPTGAASHTLAYSFVRDLGPANAYADSESVGLTVGARYYVNEAWSIEGYLADATETAEYGSTNRVNLTYLAEALGNVLDNPATAYRTSVDGFFNPFGSGAANSRAVLDFIGGGYAKSNNESRARSANLLVKGDLIALPGGVVSIAVGGQVREERFDNRGEVFISGVTPRVIPAPRRERTVSAIFLEARVPLIGPENSRPGVRSLDLSIAGRIEDYDDFGTTTNPKIGIVWSPMESLGLRASWGTSFRAGALQQIFEQAAVSPAFLKRADGSEALALLLIGGNEDLRPETSETFTAGIDFKPPNRATLSLNLFETRFEDRIAQPVNANFDGALIDPALRPFVTPINPAASPADLARIEGYAGFPGYSTAFPATAYGAIVDTRWVNTGAVRVRGVDLSGSKAVTLVDGTLTATTGLSWILGYDNQTTPAAPIQKVVGRIGYPVKIRARSGASWSNGTVTVGAYWNYVDSYRDAAGGRIEAWNTVDAQVGWSPSGQGLQLLLTAQNLLNEDPPFYDAPSGYGFDGGGASPLGRVVSLQLIRRW